MNIALRPELEQFIADQVKAGRYSSADEVVEDALSRLMRGNGDAEEEIDDETFAALQRSDEQVRAGQGMTMAQVREHFRRRGADVRPPEEQGGP